MNILKSHFWYHKSQRNGIFIIVLLILILQSIIFCVDFSSEEAVNISSNKIATFQKEMDSLQLAELENAIQKPQQFNPNYITDYKGAKLGMSLQQIDRLLAFRKTNKFINSEKEFQQVTKVSDSLLNKISPYFKFPNWVLKGGRQSSNGSFISDEVKNSDIKKVLSTIDINKATAEDFKTISGIGSVFSERIIKYRSKLQGFSFESQIDEVWGLDKEVAAKVVSIFKIIEKPIIKKVNVNINYNDGTAFYWSDT